MKIRSTHRYLLVFAVLFGLLKSTLWGQCDNGGMEVVLAEDFDAGIPTDWSKSGLWKGDAGDLGVYPNPGSGGWAYLPLMKTSAEVAALESPSWDLSVFESGRVMLEFQVLFADYQGNGKYDLEVWDGKNWITGLTEEKEFVGKISMDISEWVGSDFKFRVRFDPEGGWAWGMGIDDMVVTASMEVCGNGVCESGENFGNCPGDCPEPEGPALAWVAPGKDLQGQSVTYRKFMRNTGCDDCSDAISLGFDFSLYGQTFNQAYLNANGSFSFGGPSADYHPEPFCLLGPQLVAAFYADIDLTYGGSLQYYADPDHHYLVATWLDAPFYGCERPCTQTNDFQIILTDGTIRQIGGLIIPPGTNVVFNYGDMAWTTGTSTGGVGGFSGQPAVVGVNQGDGNTCIGYGTFDHNGYDYGGKSNAGCGTGGINHLDFQSLCFNAGTGEYIASGDPLPLYVQPGEQFNRLEWYFIPATDIVLFRIERSRDGQTFEGLGDYDPASVRRTNGPGYAFEDSHLPEGALFYRILCITRQGQTITSEAVQGIGAPPPTIASMQLLAIGPNPFEDELSVRMMSMADQEVTWQLMDMSGRPVISGTWEMSTGRNERVFAVPSLPTGQYIWVARNKLEVVRRNLIKR